MRIGYRYNVVDIHSHILPGVDDGADDIGESILLLEKAAEEGIRDVIATPHYGNENGYAPKADQVRTSFEEVVAAQQRKSDTSVITGLRLYLGEEVFCSDHVVERFKNNEVIRINGTRYALIEFFEEGPDGDEILEGLGDLKKIGVIPILAHAERYLFLQGHRDYLKRIQDLGVLLQVNAYDLALNHNWAARETAQWLAKERMISFIGSDMHGMFPKREPRIREGVDWLYEHTDSRYADDVVRKNAEKMLRIKKYDLWDCDDYFMTPRLLSLFNNRLHGQVIRCQVFPGMAESNHNVARVVVELEDGRAYAIVEGALGPRIFRMEAYADDSNSYFGYDDSGWYWRWKGSDKPVELKNLGGVDW